jgi:hypothetical protein
MNETIIQKCNQTGPYSCRKITVSCDYKTGIHKIPATIRKLSKAIELMGYKVIKKHLFISEKIK